MHSAVSLRHTQSSKAGALSRRLCAVALAVMIGTGLARAQQQRSEARSACTAPDSARLVWAADGYVTWSETYDRPEDDKLWVQEDIANEVARALGAAIH